MNIEQLKAKIAEIRAAIAELKSGDQTADNAAKLAELRTELKPRAEELSTLEAAFADDEGDAEPAEVPAEEAPVAPAEAPVAPAEAPATPAEVPAAPEEEAPANPVALAASANDPSPTAAVTPPEGKGTALQPIVLTASSGTAGVAPGASMGRGDVFKVLQASHTAAGRVSNGKVRILEAHRWGAEVDTPGENHSTIHNTRLLADARARHDRGENMRPAALTAGGMFCGPDELIRETGVVGDRGRPVASLFPSIPISGGFRAMPDLAFNVDNVGSTVQWTSADQTSVNPADPATWKPCTDLDCFTEESYVPYMVVACTTAQRQHRWAHPEQVDRWIDLLGIEYDSVAETLLLDKLVADAGTPLTIGATGGLMEDHGLVAKVIYALASLSFSLGYQHREGSGVLDRYTLIAPVGFSEALWGDEQLRGFPSGMNTKQLIIGYIEGSTGIRIVERMDEPTANKAAAAATVVALVAGGAIDSPTTPLLPPTFRLFLLDTSQWVHGEGTMVAADWHVDGNLRLQNKMQYFLENVEILERLGVKKTHIIDVPGLILGSYTDLVGPPLP